jgi:general stress protein YciG
MTDDHHETTPRRTRGPKPGSAGAKRGGQALLRERGSEFFATIGRKGGTTIREQYDLEFSTTMGKKGGDTTRARHDADHDAAIGKKGGKAGRGIPASAHRHRVDCLTSIPPREAHFASLLNAGAGYEGRLTVLL